MTEEELARHDSKTLLQLLLSADASCDALTAERDAAYANGYSDAETEINQSVLGLENTFLHSQYADAKLRIEDLQAQTMRLSGMVRDLKKEVAISDALLISEAKVSLERLARAEAAEAERDRLREAGSNAAKALRLIAGMDLMSASAVAFNAARELEAALKGESHD